MDNHKNARLTVHGRLLYVRRIIDHGLRPVEAAQAMGVSTRTAYKWLPRYQEEGETGLANRSSRPHQCPHATADTATQEGGIPGNLFTPLDRRYTHNVSFSSYPKKPHIF